MKITVNQLRRIIKEEVKRVVVETGMGGVTYLSPEQFLSRFSGAACLEAVLDDYRGSDKLDPYTINYEKLVFGTFKGVPFVMVDTGGAGQGMTDEMLAMGEDEILDIEDPLHEEAWEAVEIGHPSGIRVEDFLNKYQPDVLGSML